MPLGSPLLFCVLLVSFLFKTNACSNFASQLSDLPVYNRWDLTVNEPGHLSYLIHTGPSGSIFTWDITSTPSGCSDPILDGTLCFGADSNDDSPVYYYFCQLTTGYSEVYSSSTLMGTMFAVDGKFAEDSVGS
jgi:hypothetical protein